nr:sensor histidine kinase [Lachnospiraceae bacterium]
DADLLGVNIKLYSIKDFIDYYNTSIQNTLTFLYNSLRSLPIIFFIVYCIMLVQQQRGTIEEINTLNETIRRTNKDLQNANSQLEEYALMTENLGKTMERNRLAREIHDTLGHTLTGISVGIDACIATVEAAPKETKEHLQKISEVARNGLLDIRQSVSELKPDEADRASLNTLITKMITDMKSVADVQIYFDCSVDKLKFDEDEESAIYRVIQESTTNAVRHGHANEVRITIDRVDNDLILVIKDNGTGCNEIKPGFGTVHIKERIGMLNGSVSFDGSDGFTVRAVIPIRWGEEYD